MQTTVTIDPDVEVLLQTAVREQQKSLDEVLNHALRRALSRDGSLGQQPYSLPTRPLGIRVSLNKSLQLADELDDQEIIRRLREGR